MSAPPDTRLHARDQARSRYTAGLECLKGGDLEGARQRLAEAVGLDPGLAVAQYELGNCLRRLQRLDEAEIALKAALTAEPHLAPACFSLAFLYRETGRLDAARDCLLGLYRGATADQGLLHQTGGLLADFGLLEEAAQVYSTVVRQEPLARNYQRLGEFQQKLGRFEAAAEAFTQAIEQDPTRGAAYMLLANTRRMQDGDRPLEARFTAALKMPGISDDAKASIHFALGKLYDDWQDHERAFEHFAAANGLRRRQRRFDTDEWRRFVVRSRRVFSGRSMPPRSATPGQPVPGFIVGMLRSGTTLVERLLTAAPRVAGLGETELLDAYVDRLAAVKNQPYPECAALLTQDESALLAEDIRRQISLGHGNAGWVLDKNPLNFMHIGLITALFPDSPIIHCRRDPLDTCLSIYFQDFAHQRNGYAYDLADLGAFYAGYEQLMSFWESAFPGRIIQVDYARLVADPAAVMQEVHAALGLRSTPAAAQPERNPATISTASVWQARQPIYKTSVGRWRNYARHLAPLQESLTMNRAKFSETDA